MNEHVLEIGLFITPPIIFNFCFLSSSNSFFKKFGPNIEAGYKRFLSGELKRKDSLVMVAATDRVLGYAFGRVEPRNWESLLDECGVLHDIYVDDTARVGGVGTALLQGFISQMRDRKMTQLVLHTATQNLPGQALFKKLGFRTTMLEMTLKL